MSFRFGMFPRMLIVMSIIFMVGLSSIPSALAKKPGPTPPGDHINITEVIVDSVEDEIIIRGEELGFGNPLEVTLGEYPPLMIVGLPTDTEIVVGLPLDIPPGDYLLTVSTGNGQSQNDEYDLTIGGAGAEGPEGPAGAEGPEGPEGPAGAQGPEGPAGANGQAGADGQAGAQGPQGPEGPEGPQGATGTGGGGTLTIQERVVDLPVDAVGDGFGGAVLQTLRIKCEDLLGNSLGKVLSAGIQALPRYTSLIALTVDLNTDEAVIQFIADIDELDPQNPPSVTGKAVCGSIQ